MNFLRVGQIPSSYYDFNYLINQKKYFYIDVIQVNFELCFIMGCGLIFHMFMSKHIKTNLGSVWAMIIITTLSILFAAFMAAMGLLPLIQSKSLIKFMKFINES